MKKLLCFLFLLLIRAFSVSAQAPVNMTGKIYDKDNKLTALSRLMVINKRTNQGSFAGTDGQFSIVILPSDTVVFSALGYKVRAICFKDSVAKGRLYAEVPIQKLQFELKEISVFAPRSLSEIQNDIDRLGVNRTYNTSGVNAFESPITALYERFSKFEQSKRKVAEWENEDLKRDVLKDLFHLYVKFDIIDLKDEEFDDFIKYLNFSDEFIKSASQFELVMAIKGKYENFKYRWK
ncbi:MAG: hypothetical protein ACJ77K_03465 [Bacteroidia bacterium]